ncbi:hypothetical protein [Paenibacillus pini]|uniref:Uncharacterized protein n=1 Tax=Paenibacillus pini JCM 16418 TaxID=1236976 RepID=W7Y776_9BACL|nr:hypothetical protein [Paenibacillus pini]GAF06795.1 hypothetical protein JCM16418_777 [Paenibacillus pini JCM 16418]
MASNHLFPVSSGLFEHKERLGAAIWEFLWCIDSVTKEEVDESGERWGIVLGGAPVKHERIAKELMSSERTVQRNMALLKSQGYISTLRIPYGEIIKVRNNKKNFEAKRSAINVISKPREAPNMAGLNDKNGISPDSDTPNMAQRYDNNGTCNKDFKELITTIPITEFDEEIIEEPALDGMISILNAYCKLHGKFDFHVKPKEREAMGKMVSGGMPVPFTIRTMELLLEEKRNRELERFKMPTSFLYYVDAIEEAWLNSQTISTSMNGVAPRLQDKQVRKNKQQKEIDDLQRFIEEEEQREKIGSR